MSKTHNQTVDLLGNTIEYQVRRSSEANDPRIDVDIHDVTVIIPESKEAQPSALLKENAAWVIDKRCQYDAYREQAPDRTFEPGQQFPFLGEDRKLVVEPRGKQVVDENTIRLRQSAIEQSSLQQVLENFYRNRAREYLVSRTDYYAKQMDVKYEKLELRNQRTRWGSCSTGGTISLNWRLIMAPPGIIDYLVVHELAHLTEQNHGNEFWHLVETQMPDYRERARWLEENSTKLIFTKDDL
jgi:predicted metal-dependent hydrolase